MSNKLSYNSRLIKSYLEYLAKHYPDVDIDSLLDYAKMAKLEVEDPAHWFNQHQVDLFHEIMNSKTNNLNISRENFTIPMCSITDNRSGFFHLIPDDLCERLI